MCVHACTPPLGIWFFNVTKHASHFAVWPTQYLWFYPFTLFPQQFTVVHHSLHTPSASDRPCLFLWPTYLWTSCCLCYPDSSVAFLPPLLEKNRLFFFFNCDFGFLSFWTRTFSFNYYWLFSAGFLLVCEMYTPELNAVLHKSMYWPQKDYPYICLFFFKRFSLFLAMV